MHSIRANGVTLGVDSFGGEADPLVLLAGGTTMVRYDLRDCGASTTVDPQSPAYAS